MAGRREWKYENAIFSDDEVGKITNKKKTLLSY